MTLTERAKPTSIEQAKGSVKEAIGKLIGDTRVEADGKAQKSPAGLPKAATPGE